MIVFSQFRALNRSCDWRTLIPNWLNSETGITSRYQRLADTTASDWLCSSHGMANNPTAAAKADSKTPSQIELPNTTGTFAPGNDEKYIVERISPMLPR